MESRHEGQRPMRRAVPAVAALVASAVLFYFGSGLSPVPALSWIAPLPVFLLAQRASAMVAAGVGFVAYLLGTANSWDYYAHSRDVPLLAGLTIAIGGAVAFGLVVVVFRSLLLRGRALLAAIAAPAVWTGILYLVSVLSPKGVMGTMAWTQADVPVVLQVASVTGFWGVEFLVLLAPAAVAAALAPGVASSARVRTGVVVALVFGIVLGGGIWRLARDGGGGATQRVALVARNEPHWAADLSTSEGRRVLESYVDQIAALPSGVDFVVLPEGGFAADEASLPVLVQPMSQLASAQDIDIVVGLVLAEGGKLANAAVSVPADGGTPVVYRKWHEGGPKFILGHDLTFASSAQTQVGMQICLDVNFSSPSREYAAAGARLMLIPALDEDVNGWQHGRTALIRGVEHGFSVAWSGQRGVLLHSDGYGRVVAETHTGGSADFAVSVADVPMGPGQTVYSRLGDWFAWLCLAVALGGVVATRFRRSPAADDPEPQRVLVS